MALYVVAWVYEVAAGAPPLNAAEAPIGGDYIAFHTAGRLLLSGRGAELYDANAVKAVQAELLDGRAPGFYDAFRNPPFFALPFVPLGALPLLWGFALWTAISIGALVASLWLLLRELPELAARWRGVTLLALAFAPVYFGLIDGENATLSLLLYVLLYRALRQGQSGWAGCWAALGMFKPQLFFLFPLVFLATRRWRALAYFALTACVLGILSLALVGADGLHAWLQSLLEAESGNAAANAWRMASLKSFFDLLLPGIPALTLSLYLATSAALVALVLARWIRRDGPLDLTWTVTSVAAVLVDPHLVDYDLTVLVCAGIVAAVTMPTVRWPTVLLYLLVVLRAHVPIFESTIQLTTLGLAIYLTMAWSAGFWQSDEARATPGATRSTAATVG